MANRDLPRWVLDTNCLIDLDERRANAVHLNRLLTAWRTDEVELAVVAVSASENQQDGRAGRDFSVFERRLSRIGLADVTVLLPPAIWDVAFYDHALWSTTEMDELVSRVNRVLFPGNPTTPPFDVASNSKWRNRLCDVLVAWACIHHKWPHLVTNDRNFHRHLAELQTLGLTTIIEPYELTSAYIWPQGMDHP